MKPTWEQLGDEYAGSSSVLIGDVDCTADPSKELCEKFEVRGYPTIKYFADGDEDGKDYKGGRDFDALKQHVVDNLEVKCLVTNPEEGCSDKQKGYIEKMKGKSVEDWGKQISRLEGMKGQAMKSENKRWLMQRLGILKQLETAGEL